jgi:uncharacterized transporter YbjL
MKRFSDYLAIKITSAVGTMMMALIFAILAVIGFPYSNIMPQTVIQWLSQTFIQLVMLSIIMVGQRLQSEQSKELHSDHTKLANKHHTEHLVEFQRIHDRLDKHNG